MPRRPEPSFELKLIIWDVAATVGKGRPTDIQRQLDYELEKRRKETSFFEDAPDVRTISRIVKEINDLSPEVVLSKLPSHVWCLRDDCETLKQVALRSRQSSPKRTEPFEARSDPGLQRHADSSAEETRGHGSVVDKRRHQLDELQDRKEQIELMFERQKELLDLEEHVVNRLSEFWSQQVPRYRLNEHGLQTLRLLRQRFEIDEIMTAIKIASEQYLQMKGESPTKESVDIAWAKLGGICTNRRLQKENPGRYRLRYIRGILRKRVGYMNEERALELLEEALENNASLESLEKHAKSARSWSQWRDGIEDFIQQARSGGQQETRS